MKIGIAARAGADDAFIAWEGAFVRNCREFALYRRVRRGEGSFPPASRLERDRDGRTSRRDAGSAAYDRRRLRELDFWLRRCDGYFFAINSSTLPLPSL
jgi:hypothetical protein